jgi:predicted HicB family RNase H-like nuclease
MPEAKSKKMIIHITPTLHSRIKEAAAAADTSMAEFVRNSVAQRLDLTSILLAKEAKGADREY